MKDFLRRIRLEGEQGGLGLSCSGEGLFLADTPLLLRRGQLFEVRPFGEIELLIKSAYRFEVDPASLAESLESVARALSAGEVERAMMAALRLRLSPLGQEAAERLARTDQALAKYNAAQPRDWHGRWTAEDDASSSAIPHGDASSNAAHETPAGSHAVSAAFPNATRGPSEADAQALQRLYPSFVAQFDELGPVEFSKQVIGYGAWLAKNGHGLTAEELANARAKYTFLEDRLSFWVGYKYKSPTADANIMSASVSLYQGAINGGIVSVGHDGLPRSMLTVAAGAMAADGPGPQLRTGSSPSEPRGEVSSDERLLWPDQLALGGEVDNERVGVVWGKGNDDQGFPFERYINERHGRGTGLPAGSKTFDNFDSDTGRASSAKTLDTTNYSYASKPDRVYSRLTAYIDAVADYSGPRTSRDLRVDQIRSRQLDLGIPDETSPAQWLRIQRAITYAKGRGVFMVVTRIRSSR